LAQQIARHVNYDPEYGFELPCRADEPETTPVLRLQGYLQMPERMLADHPQQATLFISTKKDASFGVGAAWSEGNDWKTKAASLGKYITESDAVSFAISMVVKDLVQTLSRTNQQRAEIVTTSRPALVEMQTARQWALPITTDIRRRIQRVEEEGGRVVLTWLSSDNDCDGYEAADDAAERVARQRPKEMRSASMSYVKQAIKEKWKTRRNTNKHVEGARKSVAARYLQLKSGHAVTGVHLLRIDRAQDARCWWCGYSRQTVAHLMLECRKWRRERDAMLRRLRSDKLTISSRRDWTDVEALFREEATKAVLGFIESTEVGKRLEKGMNKDDLWDVDRLDRNEGEDEMDTGDE
jgi:ribonuclease HI